MRFEWDDEKSRTNKAKHDIDFDTAKKLWNDTNRVEILTSYPIENRSILIGKIDKKLWAVNSLRIISVRRTRKKEAKLYGEKENS
jgi:uncharacterized DUF497 family protein